MSWDDWFIFAIMTVACMMIIKELDGDEMSEFKKFGGAKVSEDKTQVVFMGIDHSKGDDMTAYWMYDGIEFKEITKEEYERFANGQ